MRVLKSLGLIAFLLPHGCTMYRDIKEIKTIGFSDDLSKGKSSGQIEADDCVWQIFGYWLGGRPDIGKAIANARTQKKSNLTEAFGAKNSGHGDAPLRYINNVTVSYGGFNAYIIGKSCIEVKAMGYL